MVLCCTTPGEAAAMLHCCKHLLHIVHNPEASALLLHVSRDEWNLQKSKLREVGDVMPAV